MLKRDLERMRERLDRVEYFLADEGYEEQWNDVDEVMEWYRPEGK